MKRLALVLALGWVSGFAAADNETLYAWRFPVREALVSGHVYRIVLPPEVLDRSGYFPADLRVRDRDGQDWPVQVLVPDTRPEPETVRSRFHAGLDDQGRRILDITFPWYASQAMPLHNRVFIDGGRVGEWLHRAEVWAGSRTADLEAVGEGYLVTRRDPIRVSNRVLRYPPGRYRALRIVIDPDASTGQPFPEPETVGVDYQKSPRVTNLVQEATEIRSSAVPGRSGALETVYDLGVSNLPMTRLLVGFRGSHPAIPVNVYGGATTNGPWRWVAEDVLQPPAQEGPSPLVLSWPGYRYLKLDVYLRDPGALSVDRVAAEWPPQVLVFEAKGSGPAYLFTGADGYDLPGGRLALRLSETAALQADDVHLGGAEPNPVRLAAGLSSYQTALLSVVLLVALVLIAITGVKLLRARLG